MTSTRSGRRRIVSPAVTACGGQCSPAPSCRVVTELRVPAHVLHQISKAFAGLPARRASGKSARADGR